MGDFNDMVSGEEKIGGGGVMEFVEGGCLSILTIWITATFLIWGSWVQNLPGLIKGIFPG